MASLVSTWAGGENSLSEALCDGHLTVVRVLVVGVGPVNNFPSRVVLRTVHARRHHRYVFQFTSGLQSWMPPLLSSEASVLQSISDSARCVVAMSLSRLCSLGEHSRRHIKGRVCSCFSFSEHLLRLVIRQSRDEVWDSSPTFTCHCFYCCSRQNELRDDKWFCSDLLAL